MNWTIWGAVRNEISYIDIDQTIDLIQICSEWDLQTVIKGLCLFTASSLMGLIMLTLGLFIMVTLYNRI
jgi:hypothetical protein